MLHRNFKSAKCKTSLKLASSRIKLLKNKREAQVRQLKRELAQLLESGQDPTARIRVEHVVREEKTLAAYDLLEIYCELIVARLPIIESQKNCPIDLKEAISSVIFASPRCADVPELMEVRKHFIVKYGKDFISAAVEVRPDCGVSRLLIEKLSAKAPDGPTKIKILTAIAEEHNINWEPKSFGEKDSKQSEDLLNGPSMFTNGSQMFVNSPHVQAPHDFDDKGNTNFHVSPKNNENHGASTNFQEHKLTQSSSSQAEIGANKTNFPSAFHPTGSGVERMEFRHSYSGDRNVSSMGRQNWNMEFKDATAAAQAAAESAERASLAARAAADLASRGNSTWQYSTETRRDEEMNRYEDSSLGSEYYAKGPVNIVHGTNSKVDYEKISSNMQDDVTGISENIHRDNLKSNTESRQSASLKSSAASGDGPSLVNHLKMDDKYSRKSSSESGKTDHLTEIGLERQSSRPDLDYMKKLQGLDCKAVDDCEEAMVRKQSKQASSRLPSSKFSDDQHVSHSNSQSLESDADENPFAVHDEGIIRRNSYGKTSSETADIIYDHYVSDPDECRIDLEAQHKEGEDLHFSSHSTESPTDIFANKNTWSERRNVDEALEKFVSRSHFSTEHQFDPVFSRSWTSSTVASRPDEMLPATFDDYDAPISKETEDLNKSELVRSRDSNAANLYPETSQVTSKVTQGESHGFTSSFLDEGVRGSNKQWLQSSSFDKNHVEVHSSRNHGIGINAGSARKFGYDNATTNQASPKVSPTILDLDDPYSRSQQVDEGKHGQSQLPSRFSVGYQVRGNAATPVQDEHVEETESSEDSNPESGKGLNYPKLTGGFRNKGYTRPPYVKNPLHNASSSKQTAADTSAKFEESFPAALKVSGSTGARIQDPYYKDVREDVDRRPSTRTYSEPHDDDSLDELQLQRSTITQDQYNKKNGIEENKKSSSRTQFKYFDSTDSDSEGDFPVEASTNKARFNTGLSQRTKASRPNSKESFSKAAMLSEASGSPNYGEERNSSAKSSFRNQPIQRPPSQNKISGGFGNPDQPRLDKEAAVNPVQESKSYFGDRMKPSAKEQSSNLNPPEKEPPSNSLRKEVTSGNIENLNNPSSSGQSPSEERATHVHPKLPDYDALAAHLQSLRKTRH